MSRNDKTVQTGQPTIPSAAVPRHRAKQTQPMRRVQPAVQRPIPAPVAQPHSASSQPPRPTNPYKWWVIGGGALTVGFVMTCFAVVGWVAILYAGNGILPGVSALGVDLGGKSQAEAVTALQQSWQEGLILSDGSREWRVSYADLGIWLDAEATAKAAYDEGRSSGNTLRALFGGVDARPVMEIDLLTTQAKLQELEPMLSTPAMNAGVRLVNGRVEATAPQEGRILDVDATIAQLQQDASGMLADGVLELVMIPVAPTVFDSSPMVSQATQLLANPLRIRGFDPITNEKLDWSIGPEVWSQWLMATPDVNSPTGLALTLETTQLKSYLASREGMLDAARFLKLDEAVEEVQKAVSQNQTDVLIRLYHRERQHMVRNGETFASIGYDYGIPYPWIQAANPNVSDGLSVGQAITIPSADVMLPLPIVYNKRVVVSISQQKMWAYENDQLKWEWVVSTGIASSPTAPGIFQIQSHEPNAYAGNWNLWMPFFMGVYRPVPTSDFMNGFHGFPTRGGSQLLWTNSLGTRVTYGCILVSDTNVQQLYEWAEEGTIVEIQR